jgi:hypothetical protein
MVKLKRKNQFNQRKKKTIKTMRIKTEIRNTNNFFIEG